LVIATSHGPRRTSARWKDKPVIVNVTAYVYLPHPHLIDAKKRGGRIVHDKLL
jgi:hypothetical protein